MSLRNYLGFFRYLFYFLKEQYKIYRLSIEEKKENSAALSFPKVKISHPGNLHVGKDVFIAEGTRILFSNTVSDTEQKGSIVLSDYSWVGQDVELQSFNGSKIVVKDYSTIQDRCKILGDVIIEKYCIFSVNIFISSGNHYATLKPEWLIRDQDALVLGTDEGRKKHSKKVHIEEDCWIGWGAFVKQGIYIGRGAIIGAYTIVTKDVRPYSIIAGIPGKEIKTRFEFNPPVFLNANEDDHLPYFYRGFGQKRFELSESRKENVIFAEDECIFILKKIPFKEITIKGLTKTQGPVDIKVQIGTLLRSEFKSLKGGFELKVRTEEMTVGNIANEGFPGFMSEYLLLKINTDSVNEPDKTKYKIGVEEVALK